MGLNRIDSKSSPEQRSVFGKRERFDLTSILISVENITPNVQHQKPQRHLKTADVIQCECF